MKYYMLLITMSGAILDMDNGQQKRKMCDSPDKSSICALPDSDSIPQEKSSDNNGALQKRGIFNATGKAIQLRSKL